MGNCLLDESRETRISLNLRGFCDKLRAPAVIRYIIDVAKPDHVSDGSHMLVALLDQSIDTLQSRHAYREIYDLLGTVFGWQGDKTPEMVPLGTNGNGRH